MIARTGGSILELRPTDEATTGIEACRNAHGSPSPLRRRPPSATMLRGDEGRGMNAADQARLRDICLEVIGLETGELDGGTDFIEDLNLDREDLADLFVAVEDAFDISLEEGMRRVRTFEDLEALVDDLIPA